MFSRSRILVLALAACVPLSLTMGCKSKKPQVERRLPALSASASDTSGSSDAMASGFTPVEGWAPGAAPTDASFSAPGEMLPGAGGFDNALLDSATGDLANTASTAGVEDAFGVAELEMIHFEFDSDEITPAWQSVLDDHATWISNNPNFMVQVEGHCDDRGTEEYNVSLGQRRADAVRTYLVSRGVDPNRLSTISYGEMRPLSFEQTEEGHALNRRAMFLVYELDTAMAGGF